ncbi:MAG: amidohydrolase family protein [Planctomycetota bacterium]|jgi:predicted TIM-barrel fold metal-dependent hydrolase
MLFEIKEIDRKFYEERLEQFLPDKIIDVHTHVWLKEFKTGDESAPRRVTWPSRVAAENPIEDLVETYKLMFPGKEVTALMFATIVPRENLEAANTYIKQCAAKYNFPALIFSDPLWSGEQLEEKIIEGNFLGAKSYLSYSPGDIPQAEIRIFDFFPHHQLEVLNEHGWIVMLHIPRHGRLKDPVNLAQMIEIEKRYPNIKLIVAHVGRAYCIEDVGDAFEVLADTKNMMFDISANTNAEVFEQLIKAVGPKRILFGSDMPILRMRMRRICENGIYVNLAPKGLYGNVSGDKNMCEVGDEEARKMTFFMYEEIDAFRRAAEATGLRRDDIEDVFYNNAHRIIFATEGNTL